MPFKSKAEKREYIKAHAAYLKLLGIEPTEKNIEKIVDDPKGEELYRKSKRVSDIIEEKKKSVDEDKRIYPNDFYTHNLSRLPRILYDTSGTPEAKQWNDNLDSIIYGPNGARKFYDLCAKILLDFDESILNGSREQMLDYVANNPEKAYMLFGAVDMFKKASSILDMNKPEDVALFNAIKDKMVIAQDINKMKFYFDYHSKPLSVILPDSALDRAMEVYDFANNPKDLNGNKAEKSPEDREATIKLVSFFQSEQDILAEKEGTKELLAKKQIGKEGIYNRAYILENGQKRYITKEEYRAASAEMKAKIVDEPVSDETRKYLDDFRAKTPEFGKPMLFTSQEERAKYVDMFVPMLKSAGIEVTDAEIQKAKTDASKDQAILDAKFLSEDLDEEGVRYPICENSGIAKHDRLVSGLFLKGDTQEIREWNENLKLMAQSPEGLKALACIAAKRLLQIDIKEFAKLNPADRVQFLKDNPLERKILFIASNITDAYQSTLPEAEKNTDPIVKALLDRKGLFELANSDKSYPGIASCPLFSMFDNMSADKVNEKQLDNLTIKVIPTTLGVKDREAEAKSKEEISKNGSADVQRVNEYEKNVKQIKDAHGALFSCMTYVELIRDNNYREILAELVNSGKISKDNLHQRFYTEKEVDGKLVKEYSSIDEMIDTIMEAEKRDKERPEGQEAEKQKVIDSFKSEIIDANSLEKINQFMKNTPDTLSNNLIAKDRTELNRKLEMRNLSNENVKAFNSFVTKTVEDNELPGIKDFLAKINKLSSSAEKASSLYEAVKYVNTHMEYSSSKGDEEKLSIALASIAMSDESCAKELVRRINVVRGNHFFKKPEVDLQRCLDMVGVKLGNDEDKKVYDVKDPADKRLYNVSEIYTHLRKDLDPWHHTNSESFEKMMQAMNNVMVYANSTKKMDKRTVDKLLNDVSVASENYLKGKDAHTALGKNRKSAALAMVAALNPNKAETLIGKLSEERKSWAKDLFKKISDNPANVTTRDIMREEKLSMPFNKEEVLGLINKDILQTERRIHEADVSLDEKIDLTAQYIVKKRLNDNIRKADDKQAVNMLSKKKLIEAEVTFLKSDTFEKVVRDTGIDSGKVEIDLNDVDKKVLENISEKAQETKAENKAEIKEDVKNDQYQNNQPHIKA